MRRVQVELLKFTCKTRRFAIGAPKATRRSLRSRASWNDTAARAQ